MNAEDIKRLHYYEQQFLRTQDFKDEQAYHIEMRRRHLIAQHSWGIVVGLEIIQTDAGIWSIQPGMAVDGYGREILVFEPEPLATDQIGARIADGTLKVWIAYRVEKSDRPASGYEVCRTSNGNADQFTRVRETFRLIYQDDPPTLDQSKPYPPYELIEDNAVAYPWPVYLGTITWSGGSITAVELNERRYVGLVGAEITPPLVAQGIGGSGSTVLNTLTLRADETRVKGLGSSEPGRLVVDGNVQLNGSSLELRDSTGNAPVVPLQIARKNSKDIRVQLGNTEAQEARFVVGPEDEEKFVVGGNGDTSLSGNFSLTGAKDLKLEGGRLSFENGPGSSARAEETTEISRQLNTATGHQDLQVAVGSSDDLGARLVVGPKDGDAVLIVSNSGQINIDGSVGIGTDTDNKVNRLLTVQGDRGTYVNVKANNGTQEVLIGADNRGGIVSTMTNHDLQLRAGANDTKVTIKADGKVGVGTINPSHAFQVQGDRIRLENGSKRLDLRVDGGAVDLQTETSSLFIRSTGAGNNLIMNSDSRDGNIGIGASIPQTFFHVQKDKSGDGLIGDHVALVENSASVNADVLALKVNSVQNQTGGSNNFITFFRQDASIGRIEATDNGNGVLFGTASGDYAESLPRLKESEGIAPGEIVGVFSGKVTKATLQTRHAAVVSSQPIVVGGMPSRENKHLYETVAFVGQVPVKVRGQVHAGDYIVPSGLNDGTGIAVGSGKLTPEYCAQIVGKAWEDSEDEDVKLINTVVGLPSNLPAAELLGVIQKQQSEIRKLSSELSELKSMFVDFKEKVQFNS